MARRKGILPPGWKKKYEKWLKQQPWLPPRTGEWPEPPDEKQVWGPHRPIIRGAGMRRYKARPSGRSAKGRARMGYSNTECAWYPVAEAGEGDGDGIAIGGAGIGSNPVRLLSITAAGYKTTETGVGVISTLSGKLFRFDGKIEIYLDPSTAPSNQLTFNHAKVMYVWMKNKLNAQSVGGNVQSAASNFDPISDWANLMRRRDVIKWGWIDVVGANPDSNTLLPAGGPVASVSLNSQAVFANKRSFNSHKVQETIPFPKLPAAGLNLGAGESLDLVVKCFELSDTMSYNIVDVYAFMRFRMFMG